MATTKFKGTPVRLAGRFVEVGATAPGFALVKSDLSTLSLADLKGKRVILNIFPSLDTQVCAASVRKFNTLAAALGDTVVVAVSKDLPFAHARFCTVEGIENVVPASDFRNEGFGERYGVLMEVYGEGILLVGDSGVGKAEAAIELIKRGHRLIADDAVEIRRVSRISLVGQAPDNIRHFIELRGIGVI
ncbi:MAG: thiol peroxidase, partial [Alistipes sp.]|nr:thiol peroxidase [Alistipes sp.]